MNLTSPDELPPYREFYGKLRTHLPTQEELEHYKETSGKIRTQYLEAQKMSNECDERYASYLIDHGGQLENAPEIFEQSTTLMKAKEVAHARTVSLNRKFHEIRESFMNQYPECAVCHRRSIGGCLVTEEERDLLTLRSHSLWLCPETLIGQWWCGCFSR